MVKVLKLLPTIFAFICIAWWTTTAQSVEQKSALFTTSKLISSFRLDKASARNALNYVASAPHPLGSPRQLEIKNWLVNQLAGLGLKGVVQDFEANTPQPRLKSPNDSLIVVKEGFNVWSHVHLSNKPQCLIALASHYDTKQMDFNYLGANDSASSTVLLLELIKFLQRSRKFLSAKCDLQVLWFDGEESVLPDWNDGLYLHPAHVTDNTYGSRYFARNLTECRCSSTLSCMQATNETRTLPYAACLLLDMIAYPDLKITLDSNSHPILNNLLQEGAKTLNKSEVLSKTLIPIADDHLPFKERGIPVLNIIDFNHLDSWHTAKDRPENVSFDSMELSGRLALFVLLSVLKRPEILKENDTLQKTESCTKQAKTPAKAKHKRGIK